MYQTSSSFIAGRDLVVNGVTIAKGDVVGPAVVNSMKTFQSLVAKRWVIPATDPSARRAHTFKNSTPMPTYFNPSALNQFFAGAVLGAPTALTSPAKTTTTVDLSWTAPSDGPEPNVSDYVVQYKANASSTWLTFADGASTTTTATVTGLTTGTAYNFRILASNANGNSAPSNVLNVTTS